MTITARAATGTRPLAQYFHDSYLTCRERFRALAGERNASMGVYPIAARGPGGEALTLDTAYLGNPAPARLLTVQSGTHGIEGFAGSAIQQQFLAEDLATLSLPADGAVLLLHAVNPFGFAHERRVNEHNVDLNRNFLDHDAPPPRRPDYVALDPLLNPVELTEATEQAFLGEAYRLVSEKGMAFVQRILTEGQYECPTGISYGGARLEEAVRHVQGVYGEHFARIREAVIVDVHTGLGPFGEFTILSNHPSDSPAHQFLLAHFPDRRVECPMDAASISAPLSGKIGRGLVERFPDVDCRAFSCEFGTYAGERVLQAERHENWLHHHGAPDTEQGRAIRTEFREVFCPDSADWRTRVVEGGRACLREAWAALFDDR